MFCSRAGFSGAADLMEHFPVPRWRPPPSWKNFKWPYLRNRSPDPLHVCLYIRLFTTKADTIRKRNRVGFSGTADIMAISPQRLTIYLYSAHRAVIYAISQLSCFFILLFDFYPRDAMLVRVIAIATCLSVCPSVRHAPVLCQNEES